VTTLLVVNPVAGHGRAGRRAAEAEHALRETWGEVERVDTAAPGAAVGLVRSRVEAGVERVVVLGGDGTLHEAANGLLQAGVATRPPIAILPAGTGNDYAKMTRTLGPSTREAVRRLGRGRVGRFDVGRVADEYFVNSIGIGFDAEVARVVNQTRWGRGLPVYLAAVARVMARFQAFEAEVVADGHRFTDQLLLLEVAIGPVVGGGFRLTPFARPDDGQLDVCAIRRLSVAGILAKLPLAMLGRHTKLPDVRSFQATRVSISSPGPCRAQLDGELREVGGPMDILLEAGALPVLIADS